MTDPVMPIPAPLIEPPGTVSLCDDRENPYADPEIYYRFGAMPEPRRKVRDAS